MKMSLLKIRYENFKCFKFFEASPNGCNMSIRGENGRGKTSSQDGFYWLHYDKNSEGDTQFGVRPRDKTGQVIPGVVTLVEDVLLINGTPHTFRKEQHERKVKNQIVGYTNKYFIDDVPKKEKEFKEYHDNLCPEEKLKMLTDLDWFNNDKKNPWLNRRKTLVDIAGNIPEPAGFEELKERQNGRSLKDYEKVLKDRKKMLEDEKAKIPIRLDEKQRELDEYAQNNGDSEVELTAKRDIAQEKCNGLAAKLTSLIASSKARAEKTEKINQLTIKRLHRETILKNQQGPTDELIDERNKLESEHGTRTQELVRIQETIRAVKAAIESIGNEISQRQLTLKTIREEYTKADSPDCPTCGQKWPSDKEKPGIKDIENRGNFVKQGIDTDKKLKSEKEEELQKLIAAEAAKVEELKTAEEAKNKRIEEINEAIKNKPQVDPELDEEWKGYTVEIENIQAELGEPLSEQIKQVEAEKGLADTLLAELNKCLAQFDTIKKTSARIAELEDKQKDLAQQIADTEKELDEIGRFKIAESKLVEAAVNGMFKHITWKLFEFHLNGEIKEICECVLNGVPYGDMSFGQKIFAGVDCINTLSDHYGVEVPLFIDRAESLSLPIETESQVIRLVMDKSVKELKVEVAEKPRLQEVA